MNEPIISPWLIYLVYLLGSTQGAAVVVFFTGIIVAILCGLILLAFASLEDDFSIFQRLKYWKSVIAVLAGALVLATVVPNRETATAMLIAKKATPENYKAIRAELISLIGDVKEATAPEHEPVD